MARDLTGYKEKKGKMRKEPGYMAKKKREEWS